VDAELYYKKRLEEQKLKIHEKLRTKEPRNIGFAFLIFRSASTAMEFVKHPEQLMKLMEMSHEERHKFRVNVSFFKC